MNKETKEEFEEILSEGVLREIKEYEESAERERASLRLWAIKEGKEEGRKERNIEIAQKLLKASYKIEDIIEITELSKEEILKLM